MAGSSLRIFVADASVVVKWFVDEEYSDRARALRDLYVDGRVRLFAPSLVEYEVANALRYHPFVRLSDAQISQAVATLRTASIPTLPTIGVWTKTLELSRVHTISIYDAVYIASASAAAGICVTADDVIVRAMGAKAAGLVMHLRDLELA